MPRTKPAVAIIPLDHVQARILLIRGQRVIIDTHLAQLYGIPTKRLNEAVRRNADRFPDDFMFRLTRDETAILRSQIATLRFPATRLSSGSQAAELKGQHGKHSKYLPFAFTEHGAIMAATVLNSPQAVKASVFVVRAFVQLRQLFSTHHQLAGRLDELERKLQDHDDQILSLIDAIRQLMDEPDDAAGEKSRIGFQTELSPPKSARARRRLIASKV